MIMKRILLFPDGTGNSSAKAQKTNVWRLLQAADLTGMDPIARYDDGVGTRGEDRIPVGPQPCAVDNNRDSSSADG
jgi:uncharacterized protein (DUF2235 family)